MSNILRTFAADFDLCGYGVIGSRARLRILFREEWGFEPPYPHKSDRVEE